MVKLTAIRHTGIRITDVPKAKEFYGQILGLTELPRPELPYQEPGMSARGRRST